MPTRLIPRILFVIFYQPIYNAFFLVHNLFTKFNTLGSTIILFTLILKLILLPLTLIQNLSREQRSNIEKASQDIEKRYPDDPLTRKKMTRRLIRDNRSSIVAAFISLIVQFIVIISLYHLMLNGLNDSNYPILYNFVPSPDNLSTIWLSIDLLRPHFLLTFITCFAIFIERTIAIVISPFPETYDKTMQYLVPIGSFIIVSRLPSGINLFLLTITLFNLLIFIIRETAYWVTLNVLSRESNDEDADE